MAETENHGGEPAAFLADRHRNPALHVAQPRRTGYVFSGICAIAATLVFVAILVVLWIDWTALKVA